MAKNKIVGAPLEMDMVDCTLYGLEQLIAEMGIAAVAPTVAEHLISLRGDLHKESITLSPDTEARLSALERQVKEHVLLSAE